MAAGMVAGIEPWTQTLRCLCVVQRLRTELAAVTSLRSDAEDAARWMDEEQAADVADRLVAYATAWEAAQTRDGVPLAELVTARLRAQITTGLRKALAVAPDPATHPLHSAWEQPMPGTAGLPRDSNWASLLRGGGQLHHRLGVGCAVNLLVVVLPHQLVELGL